MKKESVQNLKKRPFLLLLLLIRRLLSRCRIFRSRYVYLRSHTIKRKKKGRVLGWKKSCMKFLVALEPNSPPSRLTNVNTLPQAETSFPPLTLVFPPAAAAAAAPNELLYRDCVTLLLIVERLMIFRPRELLRSHPRPSLRPGRATNGSNARLVLRCASVSQTIHPPSLKKEKEIEKEER